MIATTIVICLFSCNSLDWFYFCHSIFMIGFLCYCREILYGGTIFCVRQRDYCSNGSLILKFAVFLNDVNSVASLCENQYQYELEIICRARNDCPR